MAVKNLPGPLLLLSLAYTIQRYGWQAYGALTGQGASGRFVASGSRGALISLLLRAYVEAVGRLPEVWRQRRQIQAQRRVPTTEVGRWLRRYGVSARHIALME